MNDPAWGKVGWYAAVMRGRLRCDVTVWSSSEGIIVVIYRGKRGPAMMSRSGPPYVVPAAYVGVTRSSINRLSNLRKSVGMKGVLE